MPLYVNGNEQEAPPPVPPHVEAGAAGAGDTGAAVARAGVVNAHEYGRTFKHDVAGMGMEESAEAL